MALGDLDAAIRGYRESVSLVAGMGSATDRSLATTYWGLGVALDRAGNLEAGLGAIAIARAYDRGDSAITSTSGEWFFSPAWDSAWYFALGHWEHARAAKLTAARIEHYVLAVALWEEYLAKAPADDRYLPIARAHLKQCEHERDVAMQRRPGGFAPKAPAPSGVSRGSKP